MGGGQVSGFRFQIRRFADFCPSLALFASFCYHWEVEKKRARHTALVIITIFAGVAALTFLISLLIRGYRPNWKQRQLKLLPNGLLVAKSYPDGASVFVNGKLATATNDTLNLPPKKYQIKIEKDGFLPWQKDLEIKKEVVAQTNAVLFLSAPDLRPLTNTGAINPTFSPDGTKIIYAVTNAPSSRKNGIWLLDLSSTLPLTRANTKQLTGPMGKIDWKKTDFVWSPDNKNVVLIEKKKLQVSKAFLINVDRFTPLEQLNDVSYQLSLILQQWQNEKKEELKNRLKKLPIQLVKIATESASLISFSPDEKRFFYLATESAKIAENLIPHPPARSTQPEERDIKPNNIYVYDLKEDTNFRLGTAEELGVDKNFQFEKTRIYWLDNYHLLFIDQEKKEIKVIEADATNQQTIYSGPFEDNFIFPSPSGKSLIILTSLHPDSPGDLYEVKVR